MARPRSLSSSTASGATTKPSGPSDRVRGTWESSGARRTWSRICRRRGRGPPRAGLGTTQPRGMCGAKCASAPLKHERLGLCKAEVVPRREGVVPLRGQRWVVGHEGPLRHHRRLARQHERPFLARGDSERVPCSLQLKKWFVPVAHVRTHVHVAVHAHTHTHTQTRNGTCTYTDARTHPHTLLREKQHFRTVTFQFVPEPAPACRACPAYGYQMGPRICLCRTFAVDPTRGWQDAVYVKSAPGKRAAGCSRRRCTRKALHTHTRTHTHTHTPHIYIYIYTHTALTQR